LASVYLAIAQPPGLPFRAPALRYSCPPQKYARADRLLPPDGKQQHLPWLTWPLPLLFLHHSIDDDNLSAGHGQLIDGTHGFSFCWPNFSASYPGILQTICRQLSGQQSPSTNAATTDYAFRYNPK